MASPPRGSAPPSRAESRHHSVAQPALLWVGHRALHRPGRVRRANRCRHANPVHKGPLVPPVRRSVPSLRVAAEIQVFPAAPAVRWAPVDSVVPVVPVVPAVPVASVDRWSISRGMPPATRPPQHLRSSISGPQLRDSSQSNAPATMQAPIVAPVLRAPVHRRKTWIPASGSPIPKSPTTSRCCLVRR